MDSFLQELNPSTALNSERYGVKHMFHVERMRREHFPFAVQLANTMDWNMAESDFEFNANLEPDGCFVLFQARDPVGIATCISYGTTGWFGNLAVKEEHRKAGAGTTLVKHALEYLTRKGVETIGLYAYNHLVGFYEKLGFKPQGDFVILSGKQLTCKLQGTALKSSKKDIPALIDFDRRCFGWERKKLLELLLLAEENLSYLSIHNSKIVGFAVAKVYDAMAEIGPVVCGPEQSDVAVDLLRTMLDILRNRSVYVYLPDDAECLLTTLLDVGFKEKFRVKRMFLGPPIAQSCVYLPESLERG
jgi:ribosomal protein S18 acetylase RimI-like enzyme